jgi:hypothetical protein
MFACSGGATVATSPPPLATAFTYQGRLEADGEFVTGAADFRFSVWNAEEGGEPCGSTIEASDRVLDDGLFTILLDFGADCFPLEERWVQIAVRIDDEEPFEILQPRQKLTPTPYALRVRQVENCELTDEMELGSGDPAKAGFLKLFNALGRITAQFLGDQDGGSRLALSNGQSENRETIVLDGNAGPSQGGRMDLLAGDGTTPSVSVYQTPDQGGELDLFNNSGRDTVGFTGGGSDHGAYLIMQNGKEPNVPTVFLNADTSSLALTDSAGGTTFVATGDTAGGSAVSLVYDGIDTIRLSAKGAYGGGDLKLKHGPDDRTLANLFTTGGGGQLDLNKTDGSASVKIQADEGGGTSRLLLYDGVEDFARVWLLGDGGVVNDGPGGEILLLHDASSAQRAGVRLHATPTGGLIVLRNEEANDPVDTIVLDSNEGDGGARMAMRNGDATGGNPETIVLDANHFDDGGGIVALIRGDGNSGMTLEAGGGAGAVLHMRNLTASTNTITMVGGGDGDGGKVSLANGQEQNLETVSLDASGSTASRGAKLTLRNLNPPIAHDTIVLDAGDGTNSGEIILANSGGLENVRIGARGPTGGYGGDLQLFNPNADSPESPTVALNASPNGGLLTLFKNDNSVAIQLDGSIGNARFAGVVTVCDLVEVGGCDVAEAFDFSDRETVAPGMVMVIDSEKAGHLKLSTNAYDSTVAGIISGAGNLQPGMSLGRRADGTNDLPIALSGRVYCYVEATENAIEVGDLLTTSSIPGHAMKAADRSRAFGTIVGKAMEPLARGQRGLILVFVMNQ